LKTVTGEVSGDKRYLSALKTEHNRIKQRAMKKNELLTSSGLTKRQ